MDAATCWLCRQGGRSTRREEQQHAAQQRRKIRGCLQWAFEGSAAWRGFLHSGMPRGWAADPAASCGGGGVHLTPFQQQQGEGWPSCLPRRLIGGMPSGPSQPPAAWACCGRACARVPAAARGHHLGWPARPHPTSVHDGAHLDVFKALLCAGGLLQRVYVRTGEMQELGGRRWGERVRGKK